MTDKAAPKKDNKQRSVWFITKNNIPQDESTDWQAYWATQLNIKDCLWMVWQVEKGSSKGHIHIHCVVSFTHARRFEPLHKQLGRPHLEWLSKKDKPDVFWSKLTYTQKERTRIAGPFTHGYIPSNTSPVTAILKARDAVKAGQTFKQLIDNDELCGTAMRYKNCLKDLVVDEEDVLREKAGKIPVEVIVYWGKSGTGKSHDAKQFGPYAKVEVQNDKVYFGKYVRQETLIIDEFKSNIPLYLLLQILDGHPHPFSVRYGTVWNWWKRVVITSQSCPEDWYPNITSEERVALISRMSKIVEYNGKNRRLANGGPQYFVNTDGELKQIEK